MCQEQSTPWGVNHPEKTKSFTHSSDAAAPHQAAAQAPAHIRLPAQHKQDSSPKASKKSKSFYLNPNLKNTDRGIDRPGHPAQGVSYGNCQAGDRSCPVTLETPLQLVPSSCPRWSGTHSRVGCLCHSLQHSLCAKQSVSGAGQEESIKNPALPGCR